MKLGNKIEVVIFLILVAIISYLLNDKFNKVDNLAKVIVGQTSAGWHFCHTQQLMNKLQELNPNIKIPKPENLPYYKKNKKLEMKNGIIVPTPKTC